MAYRVLIVDDAAFMRMMIKQILNQDPSFEVVGEARDGEEAIKKYIELKPDIVTLDVTMPKISGIETLKKIKEIDANAKVVMCSAMGQRAIILECIQNGADNFIVKPFQNEKVIETLKKTIE